jgi:hypothetical protein
MMRICIARSLPAFLLACALSHPAAAAAEDQTAEPAPAVPAAGAEGAVFNPFGQGLGGAARIGANAAQPASTEPDDVLLALVLAAAAGGALWYLLRGAVGE